MCPQLLATSAPSLGWTSLETSTLTGSLPSLPSVYLCSPVVWQWCNKTVVQCSECPWLHLASALWLLHLGKCLYLREGLSPKAFEPAGSVWLEFCLVLFSLSHFTWVPLSASPGAHIATSDVFQKSTSLHTFPLQTSQRRKQRYNVLIAKILITRF